MFQPMKSYSPPARKPLDLDALPYPMLGFYKYDGIRAVVTDDLKSRKLKLIPNENVRRLFAGLRGVDGELICGSPTAPDCYNRTESKIMTRGADARGVMLYVFDWFLTPDLPYLLRHKKLGPTIGHHARARIVRPVVLKDAAAVRKFEAKAVKAGYEGIMLRSPDGIYKSGRSTLGEAYLIKLKRFQDGEAVITGVFTRMRNTNPQERDATGAAKRSKRRGGLVPTKEIGGFHCRDVKTKVEFDCAPGLLSQAQRMALYGMRLTGKVLKYRCQPAGAMERPRFPRCIGFRSRIDF